MGRIILSDFISDIRGKVGGTVYSRNRFGFYRKALVIPINPRTEDQVKVRDLYTGASKLYGSLSNSQMLLWQSLAQNHPQTVRGKTTVLTSFLMFMKLNRNLQEIDETPIVDAPPYDEPQIFDSFSVDIVTTPGSEDITLNISPAIASGTKIKVFATRVLKPGVRFVDGNFRKIAVLDSTFISGGSIEAAYIAKFGGSPRTGEKAAFRIVAVSKASGFAGSSMQTISVATA